MPQSQAVKEMVMTDDEFLALARKATPGEWEAVLWGDHVRIQAKNPSTMGMIVGRTYGDSLGDRMDADYIAAANPADSIARIERHRAEIERLRQRYRAADEALCEVVFAVHPDWGTAPELRPRQAVESIGHIKAELERLTERNNKLVIEAGAYDDLLAEMRQRAEAAESQVERLTRSRDRWIKDFDTCVKRKDAAESALATVTHERDEARKFLREFCGLFFGRDGDGSHITAPEYVRRHTELFSRVADKLRAWGAVHG